MDLVELNSRYCTYFIYCYLREHFLQHWCTDTILQLIFKHTSKQDSKDQRKALKNLRSASCYLLNSSTHLCPRQHQIAFETTTHLLFFWLKKKLKIPDIFAKNNRLFCVFTPISPISEYFGVFPVIFLFDLDCVLVDRGTKYWGKL